MSRFRAEFANSGECIGQAWREAIAVLNARSAELRLEAARYDLERVTVSQYEGRSGHDNDQTSVFYVYSDRMVRAEKLDKLAHWLRDNMDLPKTDQPA